MDRDLAQAVINRYQEGLPVFEGTLYKAAALLGIDPEVALLEARFYTVLDHALLEKRATGRPLEQWERQIFSYAAGVTPGQMEKTAATYQLDPDELVLLNLERRGWEPDLEKLALMPAAEPGPMDMSQMDPTGQGGQPPPMQGQQGNPMMAPPQPDQQVQQQPDARGGGGYPLAPTAQGQMPPSPEGNLQQLLEQAQQAQGAQQGGGLPPAGGEMQPPPPPPPTPEEKLQQVQPDLPPENAQRYAQLLTNIEQQTGIAVTDPKQIQKIIQAGQKQDQKVIDEAIKKQVETATLAQSTSLSPKPAGQPQQAQQPSQPPQGAQQPPQGGADAMSKAAERVLQRFFG